MVFLSVFPLTLILGLGFEGAKKLAAKCPPRHSDSFKGVDSG
jgi:hypothetical protein